ncbi:ABC transporter substrate-binding protein [Paucibacter sp. O1-1]|nr:ABC transporter substrate-binding protein [Paucibacter sp. O1-1]MDA3829953.1 ABC transporter substrate-binding protein [Paucibacter sp. O1-1]
MTLRRRTLAQAAALMALPLATHEALAQRRKDAVVLGMVLEPPGLDPTTAPAAAIGEIVHYNILEGLTKISPSGSVSPLLAQDWTSDPDGKVYAFTLRRGIKFQDGTVFDAAAVRFSFERAKAEGSTNKAKKAVFDNISSIATPDAQTVILTLNNPDPNLPFRLGENTAVILSPKSAATTAANPVGTGPYKLENWQKGSAVTLTAWDGYRDAGAIKIRRATFRFINDNAAQVAALLAGDIDGMPRFGAVDALAQFKADKRFTVEVGSTAGKGMLALNNKRKPLDDVRVRRAIAHAIDRQAFIDGVLPKAWASPSAAMPRPPTWAMSTSPAPTPSAPTRPAPCSRRQVSPRRSTSR